MRFAELVATYESLSGTTKRLEMRRLLVEFFRRVPVDELPTVVYLSQGLLRPEFEGVELGLADSLAQRAVALSARIDAAKVAQHARSSGDLGTTAEELLKSRRGLDRATPLEIRGAYESLRRIATASGAGSQDVKIQSLADLLNRATGTEAKYLVRFVLGRLRLGVREMTILDALAKAFAEGTKEARATIEGGFNVCSDLGLVAERLARDGLTGVRRIHLTVGRPIRPMLSERSPNLEDVLRRMNGRAAFEYKYDGLRVQAHVPANGGTRLFSRRLEDISGQFPELLADLPQVLRKRPAIVEGECVSVDPETEEIRPFQEISRRRGRKYDLERMQEEVPVRLFLFDLLLQGEEDLTGLSFPERRERLVRMVRESDRSRIAVQRVVTTVDEATSFFDQSIAEGCEGIMAKSLAPGSAYRAGARGFWWIKYKREYTHDLADSIDGVVVGAFHGRGRRAGRYGALLMAVYNPKEDRFESFCKVGSGFDDETLAALPKRLRSFEVEARPDDVLTELTPDRWMRPGLVLEVRGAELSLSPIHRAAVGLLRPEAGLALRFPRFTGRFRDDKAPTDATTADELVELYNTQVRKSVGMRPEADAS